MEKKTKIIATISDLRCDVEFLRELFEAGMNVVRINSAHASIEGANKIVDNVRRVSDQIAIMIDTKGPEIRVSGMADEFSEGIKVEEGELVRIQGGVRESKSSSSILYLNDENIYTDVPVGSRILIDDGDLELKVIDREESTLISRVMNSGTIKAHKSVNIPDVEIDLPSITPKDIEFIEWAIEREIDFIAHSFVRTKEDVLGVKRMLELRNSPIKIISKIENREGVQNIDEILTETYGIMVARGDLGIEIPAEEIPITQIHIVKKCIESKTPVIIATQMLHSMIENPRPTRAEISDVAGAVYQKVDAIMLSGETANGDYPIEAVRTMARVAIRIEKDTANYTPDTNMNMVLVNNEVTAQLARSAVRATLNLPIKAIVIDTMSGRTARYLSAFRGNKPVYAVCYEPSVMRQLALSFGIYAIYREPDKDHSAFLMTILYYLERKKWLYKEDLIVVVGGSFGVATGATFMEIGNVLNLKRTSKNDPHNDEFMGQFDKM